MGDAIYAIPDNVTGAENESTFPKLANLSTLEETLTSPLNQIASNRRLSLMPYRVVHDT